MSPGRRFLAIAGGFTILLAGCGGPTTSPPSSDDTSVGASQSEVARSAAPQTGPVGELAVAYGAIGPNRHPYAISSVPDEDIVNAIFDPLVRLTPDGEIVPVLAESYEQTSDTTWRFTLRSGVTFHDGSPLTAEDAKFSLEHYLAEESTGGSYLYSPWLEGVTVIDDLTFDVVSSQPSRVAIAGMGYLSHIIPHTATDPEAFAAAPVGTGPYKFVEFVPNDRVIVEANPDYWGEPKPSFERITFRQIAEGSSRVAALETGEVDYIANVPTDDVERLEGDFEVASVPSNRAMFIRFNLDAEGPYDDVQVRQALNHAIDRASINEALFNGLAAEAEAPLTHGIGAFNGELPSYGYDPDRARELLAEAGLADGFEAVLATPDGRYLKDREVAEAIAGQLEPFGIRLQIVPLEWATYLEQVRAEQDSTGLQYGVSLMAWGNLVADADFGLSPFVTDGSWNLGGYSNPEVDSLLEEGRSTFDEDRLRQIYDEVQALIWEDAPWIFLFDLPSVNAMSTDLIGADPRPDEKVLWGVVSRAP